MGPVIFSCAGVTYHLLLNGAALFDIYEEFGSKGFVLDHIKGNGKESFRPTCWILAKLSEQGELLRRYQGFDAGPIPTEETFLLNLSPLEVPLAKDAIARAVREGFHREEGPRKKEVDKGLLELQKKRRPDDPKPIHKRGVAIPGVERPGSPAVSGWTNLGPCLAGKSTAKT